MVFDKLINEIDENSSGVENLLLAGVDGIVVARKTELEMDDYLVAEAANLIKEAQRFGEELGSTDLVNLTTHYQDQIILIQMVSIEYFLLAILKDSRSLGKLRYRMSLKSHEWYSAIA